MKRTWDANWSLTKLDESILSLKNYIQYLEKSLEEKDGVILPLEEYPKIPYYKLAEKNDYYNKELKTPEQARKIINEWLESCKPINEKNEIVIKNNTEIYEKIVRMLKNLGLPETETVQDWGKNRKSPKTYSEISKWLSGLSKYFPRNNEYKKIEENYKKCLENIKSFEDKLIKEKHDKEIQEEKEKKEKEKLITLCSLISKYNLPNDSSERDVLSEIIEKNKYLRLAHFLLKNRGDWNDGPEYAKNGIEGFDAVSEEDQDISEEIYSYVSNWDGDGRIFRDCHYNYDYLFSKVELENPELYKDYYLIKELCGEY